MQNFQDLSDEELETVVGGSHRRSGHSHTDAQVNVQANAEGGRFGIDKVIARTKSISISVDGESTSVSVGVSLGLAI
jgi:hypothetical protein